MKKILASIMIVAVLIVSLSFVACGSPEHTTHTYDQEVATETYLKTPATCTAKAVYYKSCTCGEKGTDTFEYGEKLQHTFDQEVATEAYLKTPATCTAKAVYYKSCTCGEKGTDTFEYGEKLAHSLDCGCNVQAKIGDIYYVTFEEAIEEATENATIVLLRDLEVEGQINILKKLVLDLNGKTISNTEDIWNETLKTWSIISVQENGDLTIQGQGIIDAKENDCYALDVRDNGKITINDGTYIGNISAVYVHNGELTINAGDFSIKQLATDERYTLNCRDEAYKNDSAKIVVKGGSFKNFDPSNNLAEGKNTSFVSDEYSVTQNGNYYVVGTKA